MRAIVGFCLAVAAGCFPRAAEQAGNDDADDGDPGLLLCASDADCVGAGASCCACPEYAVHRDSPFAQACEDLDCPAPDPMVCGSLEPRCGSDGTCALACRAITCELAPPCSGGFAVDADGCLACECATGLSPECVLDTDCVRVPADCCGCAQGGADTAVPGSLEQEHRDGLGCPPSPVCPGVDVCDPTAVVTCAAGRCTFGASGAPMEVPDDACGTPELPECPPGQMCVLNSDPEATLAGVGVCQ
jgi:hypothetical protein